MGFASVTHESQYYPEFAIVRLSSSAGRRWADLIEWVKKLPLSDPHTMALTRTIRGLVKSLQLDPGLKHDPLCAACATTTLAAYRGSEEELISLYHENLNAINHSIKTMRLNAAVARERAA